MKKNLLILFLILLTSWSKIQAECVLEPLTLKERLEASTLIVEARIVSKTPFWNDDQSMIMTANEIAISKVYKGSSLISTDVLNIITLGGQIGMKAVKVEPELDLEIGSIGILMLVQKDGQWVSESGPQGFINIDKHTAIANDVFNTWPAFTIQNTIEDILKQAAVNVNPTLTKIVLSSKRAAPSISSISPLNISAGTSTVITIKGLNFQTNIDTNSVQFKNGDDGGTSFIKALKRDYISWSDTMIKLMVRTKAGTGQIRVVAGSNGLVTSTDTLKIAYAHLNVVQGDTIGYETQEIGMNSNNGITWKMNKTFFDSTGARGAFIRSLERWRCGTFINWDTLGKVNFSSIKGDGVNICAWDTNSSMGSGVLAQCFSFWSGCFTPGLKWYVNELDIRFRIKPTGSTNWNYTTGNANSNQFHFESVATHELGHGHQLGHVINSAVVMHYSIANGQTKPTVTTNDISGGSYVITKSGTSICGKNAHTKLNSGNCAIVAPSANYIASKTQICKNETVTFTDSSLGNITAYSWNFGANATPSSANTKGPHTVTYSAGGIKTTSLTITTLTGNLVKNKAIDVKNDIRMVPNFTYSAAEKGKVTFTNTSTNPNANIWYFGDGDSSLLTSPVHIYTSGGTKQVKLISTNTCNTDDSIKSIKFAYLNYGVSSNSVCINQPLMFVDSSDANVSTWQWTFTGGTPSSATGKGPHAVKYSSSGNYNASLTVTVTGSSNQSFTQSGIANVGTDTLSDASFIYGYYGKNMVGFENKSKGSNLTYKWYFGDGDSSISKDPVHTYTNANNKTVRLVVTGDCNTDDTIIQLRDFTSVNHLNNVDVSLVPNPSNGGFKIQQDTKFSATYEIFDLSGKLISSGNATSNETVSTADFESGTYFVRVRIENNAFNLVLNVLR